MVLLAKQLESSLGCAVYVQDVDAAQTMWPTDPSWRLMCDIGCSSLSRIAYRGYSATFGVPL